MAHVSRCVGSLLFQYITRYTRYELALSSEQVEQVADYLMQRGS